MHIIKKFLKWSSIFLLMIIIITGVAVSLFFHYLSPAKLTPLVNQYATEYLGATVHFDSIQVKSRLCGLGGNIA